MSLSILSFQGEKVVIDGTKDINELKSGDWRRLTGVDNPNNFPIYFTTLKVDYKHCMTA